GDGTAVPVSCTATSATFVPAEGEHTFAAVATDRAGNASASPTTADEVTMKVDSTPPISKLLLGPSSPDGSDGPSRSLEMGGVESTFIVTSSAVVGDADALPARSVATAANVCSPSAGTNVADVAVHDTGTAVPSPPWSTAAPPQELALPDFCGSSAPSTNT